MAQGVRLSALCRSGTERERPGLNHGDQYSNLLLFAHSVPRKGSLDLWFATASRWNHDCLDCFSRCSAVGTRGAHDYSLNSRGLDRAAKSLRRSGAGAAHYRCNGLHARDVLGAAVYDSEGILAWNAYRTHSDLDRGMGTFP